MRILFTLLYALIIAFIDKSITGKVHMDQVSVMILAYVFLMFCIHMAIANYKREEISWFEYKRTKYLSVDEEI